MKYLVIACGVLNDDIESCAKRLHNEYIFWYVPEKLHTEPQKLWKNVQELIDKADEELLPASESADGIEGILLVIGLCGGMTNGISSKKHSLTMPRIHDCISLYLGSAEKYDRLFKKYGGKVYWFSPAFFKQEYMPSEKNIVKRKLTLMEQFDDEEAVDYIIETEMAPLQNYTHGALVDDETSPSQALTDEASSMCASYKWQLDRHVSSPNLFISLLNNDDSDSLVHAKPHESLFPSNDDRIITAK